MISLMIFKWLIIGTNYIILKKIHEADAWTASAWYLERVYPKEFGRKDRMDLRHEVQVEVTKSLIEQEKEAKKYFKELEEEFS